MELGLIGLGGLAIEAAERMRNPIHQQHAVREARDRIMYRLMRQRFLCGFPVGEVAARYKHSGDISIVSDDRSEPRMEKSVPRSE